MRKKLQQHIFHYRTKLGFPLWEKANKLRGKPRILLYTDSRGINIPGQFDYVHYSEKLAREYSVETHLVPHRRTTLVDFLGEYQENKEWQTNFDCIILHLGIVDFSPRSAEALRRKIYPEKKRHFDRLFGEKLYRDFLKTDLKVEYEGKLTNNLYSLEMAEKYVLPELQTIPNLLFIGGNGVVPDWRGNYFRDRPQNLDIIEKYFDFFCDNLPSTLNYTHWTPEEIKKYTFDIVHLNAAGSDLILEDIEEELIKSFGV